MKTTLLLFAIAIISAASPAFAWTTVKSCDGGKIEIDQENGQYQAVLRGDLVNFLVERKGFASQTLVNPAGEITVFLGGQDPVSSYSTEILFNDGKSDMRAVKLTLRESFGHFWLDAVNYSQKYGSSSEVAPYNFTLCQAGGFAHD